MLSKAYALNCSCFATGAQNTWYIQKKKERAKKNHRWPHFHERNSNELHIGLGWGIGQNNLWKEIFLSKEKNNCNFWQVRYFKWRRFLSSTLFFFTVNWTQTAGFVTALIPLSSLYGISCRFEFHNLCRAWNRQHWLFIIWNFSLFTVMMELQCLQK